MKLEWSLFAVADREQIFDYIEAENVLAALSMDDRIQEAIETLLQFPQSGRPGRVDGTRAAFQRTQFSTLRCLIRLTLRSLLVMRASQGQRLHGNDGAGSSLLRRRDGSFGNLRLAQGGTAA